MNTIIFTLSSLVTFALIILFRGGKIKAQITLQITIKLI